MFFVAFQPTAFQSNAFQEGFGTPSLPAGHYGGDDAWKKKRTDVESKKLEFRDTDRRMRLRALIEEQFKEPEVSQAIARYSRPAASPLQPPVFNWGRIYQDMELLERQIASLRAQRIKDDDEEVLSII